MISLRTAMIGTASAMAFAGLVGSAEAGECCIKTQNGQKIDQFTVYDYNATLCEGHARKLSKEYGIAVIAMNGHDGKIFTIKNGQVVNTQKGRGQCPVQRAPGF